MLGLNARGNTGQNVYAVLQQLAGSSPGQFFNQLTPGLEAYNGANWTAAKYCIALAELTTGGSAGFYQAAVPSGLAAGDYGVVFYYRSGGSPAVSDTPFAQGTMHWSGTTEVNQAAALGNLDAAVSSRLPNSDLYFAMVTYIRDDAGAADRYSIVLTKNGVEITDPITVPKITVSKALDNSALINNQTLTLVSGARFIYNATGAERQTPGMPGIISVSATVNGTPQTFVPVDAGRDSTA